MHIATREELTAPTVCIICRCTRDQPQDIMIDTGARNDFGVQTPLTGVVYICGTCRGELNRLDDEFVRKDSVEKEQAEAAATKAEAEALVARVTEALKSINQEGVGSG